MAEALQGFQPDGLMNMVWTVLLGWMIWPFVCAFVGMNRGQAGKGFMHGMMWGPFGLIFVLMSKQKFECPTCGCKTLSSVQKDQLGATHELVPHAVVAARVLPLAGEAMVAQAPVAEAPGLIRGATAVAATPQPVVRPSVGAAPLTPCTAPSDRRAKAATPVWGAPVAPATASPAKVPPPPVESGAANPSAVPAASILEQACAGYSEEEAARLLAWVNKQVTASGGLVAGKK